MMSISFIQIATGLYEATRASSRERHANDYKVSDAAPILMRILVNTASNPCHRSVDPVGQWNELACLTR